MLAPLMTFLIGVSTALAQTQEKKLVDRLLRPDTSMVNPAQDKQFAGTSAVSFEKRVPVRSFHSRKSTLTKPFSAEQTVTPQQFAARPSRMGDSQVDLSTRNDLTHKQRIISLPPVPGIHAALESNTTVAVPQFTGNRPFLGRGKSQRALQPYDKPLTIEQVRELLNKSK